jgi:hypothetical protein
MAKRKPRRHSSNIITPINPSVHFLLFLIMALFLIIIVAGLMKQTGSDIRAKLFCPKTNFDVTAAYQACGGKFKVIKDATGCPAYECLVMPAPADEMMPDAPEFPTLPGY